MILAMEEEVLVNHSIAASAVKYSGRNTARGALLDESILLLKAIQEGKTLEEVKRKLLQGQLLSDLSYESRIKIWRLFDQRYAKALPQWALQDLIKTSKDKSSEIVSLLYINYALSDRITFDFVKEVIWPRWQSGQVAVSTDDVLRFLKQASAEHKEILTWKESSRTKIARNVLASLRDFRLLIGARNKKIQKPLLPNKTALHLLRLLLESGIENSRILSADEWKLFLLNKDDVTRILTTLAQERLIRFEKTGRAVTLDIL